MRQRVLVCGDRDWDDPDFIEAVIRYHLSVVRIDPLIHGAAPGADSMADEIAKKLGITRLPFHAEWKVYGGHAGPRRNRIMLHEGVPDLNYAFHDSLIGTSRGTRHMVRLTLEAEVPTILFHHGTTRDQWLCRYPTLEEVVW